MEHVDLVEGEALRETAAALHFEKWNRKYQFLEVFNLTLYIVSLLFLQEWQNFSRSHGEVSPLWEGARAVLVAAEVSAFVLLVEQSWYPLLSFCAKHSNK